MPVDIGREAFLRDIPLKDGTMLRLRPVKPADRDEVKRFYDEELGDTSSYMRFFGIRPDLSDDFLDRMVEFDPSSHVTIVGVRQRRVVAVASYFAGKNHQVEVASPSPIGCTPTVSPPSYSRISPPSPKVRDGRR